MGSSRARQVDAIAYCNFLEYKFFQDARGTFSKVFSSLNRTQASTEFRPRELFWSRSQRGVLRGMHLQTPPFATAKLVWVSHGVIRDVVLDVRKDSETYLGYVVTELSESSGAIYIPRGCAHGFEVVSDEAIINYAQDEDYVAFNDFGVAWNSFGVDWTTEDPIVSERDSKLPPLSDFDSPFLMADSR